MEPFIFTILLFSVVLVILIFLLSSLRGKWAVYLSAVTATLSAWFIGLLLDANIEFGIDLAFRILFPVLAMWLCILRAIIKPK